MKNQFVTALVILSMAYFCHSLKVQFTHGPINKIGSDLQLNCSTDFKDKSFYSLNMTKDNLQFYSVMIKDNAYRK